jgi:hypothetical protein
MKKNMNSPFQNPIFDRVKTRIIGYKAADRVHTRENGPLLFSNVCDERNENKQERMENMRMYATIEAIFVLLNIPYPPASLRMTGSSRR